LKYRSETTSVPSRLKLVQKRSAASLATAYGEIGSGNCDSARGSSPPLPYTDDEEAFTTRRTASSRAASSTLSVPSTLTAVVVSGSCTERGTEGSVGTRPRPRVRRVTSAMPDEVDVAPELQRRDYGEKL
jgi:hypothetical protein